MTPAAVSLAFFIVEEAIKEEPAIAVAIQKMFSGGIPTADEWALLRSAVANKSYADYVPASDLPPTETK